MKEGSYVPPPSTPAPRLCPDPHPDHTSPDSVLFPPESPGNGDVWPNGDDQASPAGGLSDKKHHTCDGTYRHGAAVSSQA